MVSHRIHTLATSAANLPTLEAVERLLTETSARPHSERRASVMDDLIDIRQVLLELASADEPTDYTPTSERSSG